MKNLTSGTQVSSSIWQTNSVISDVLLFLAGEEGVRRGSFCNKRIRLTRMSRSLLQWRWDIRGGEGVASLHRCDE